MKLKKIHKSFKGMTVVDSGTERVLRVTKKDNNTVTLSNGKRMTVTKLIANYLMPDIN